MKIDFLRGACTIIEANGLRIMTDPWLTDGEYYGAWAHYPPYEWKDDLSGIDYIYVSHIHPDHFSVPTMQRLPKVPVLVHDFKAKFLRRNIEALGFEVREIPHGQAVDLGRGVRMTILAADDCNPEVCGTFFGCTHAAVQSTQIDSLCVIEDGREVLVNVNDCPYQLARHMLPKMRTQWPVVDHLLVAYAGAGPYPQCFVMPADKRAMAAATKRVQFVDHVIRFARDLDARRTYPFAGDYVLCGKLARLNPYRGVPEVADVCDALATAGIRGPHLGTLPTLYERAKYISDVLAKRRLDYEDDEMPKTGELVSMMVEANERMRSKQREVGFRSKTTMYVDLGEVFARIILDGDGIGFTDLPTFEPRIVLRTDPRLLKRILLGPKHAHWNNAEIGSHITFERVPDVFERGIHQIVSFLHT